MTGLEHIEETFNRLAGQGRAALMPYFTLGYPSPAETAAVLAALEQSGADLIEVGVPFSDPLADGPTIQHSTQTALAQGMSVRRCLALIAEARRSGVAAPFLLMGYINPILSYGIEQYAADAAAAGADGLIVPDLPMEEAGALEDACRAQGLAFVYLVSPESTPERIAMLCERTSGFLYLVSLSGVTGAREALPQNLAEFVARVRAAARTPIAVGFGISTPEQAQAVAALADGVIIGSALIRAVDASALGEDAQPATTAVAEFLSPVRAALDALALAQ